MSPSGSPPTPDVERELVAPYRVDLRAVLAPFERGRRDPAQLALGDGTLWRTMRSPEGPATLRLRMVSPDVVACAAWGAGADWAVSSVPGLLGFGDDPAGFPQELLPDRLKPAWRRHGGRLRTLRSELVVEALVAAILEQKVTGVQSRRAWAALLAEAGDAAPGPTPREMRVFPTLSALRAIPSWTWHRWGVEPPQSATIMRVGRVAGRLDECAALPGAEARRRLAAVPGIGGWTIAEVGQRALGDADAVSFGDYHLAGAVVFAFTGESGGTDERMADLLAPFAGHRNRVQRLVELSGVGPPARGPRLTIADHRRH